MKQYLIATNSSGVRVEYDDNEMMNFLKIIILLYAIAKQKFLKARKSLTDRAKHAVFVLKTRIRNLKV